MKRIQACPACGSPVLETPGLRYFAVPGAADLAGMQKCRACGWRGFPITVPFDKLAALQALKKKEKKPETKKTRKRGN